MKMQWTKSIYEKKGFVLIIFVWRYKMKSSENKIIAAYCSHLKKGFSEMSFLDAGWEEVENTAKELDEKSGGTHFLKMINQAKREGRLYCERIGLEGISGEIPKFNGSAWMFLMKNRFGWKDKNDSTSEQEEKIINVKLGFGDEDK